ncbi:MAG: DUF6351 family protein, partial [Bryobacteraceae bacterium]
MTLDRFLFYCIVLLSSGIAASGADLLTLRLLSGRPEMVSGGTALVEVSLAANAPLKAKLNGSDVTSAFRPVVKSGVMAARLEGLAPGINKLEVRVKGKRAKLELKNHPIGGPIFSGPHQKPFVCETEAAGLGPAIDADCSAKTLVSYFYRSNQPPASFKPFDPAAPRPADLERTTTSTGQTVDYIVRREKGTINRAIYEIAFLHVPGQPLPDPWRAAQGWNGRLVYSFGGGCRAGYRQAASGSS